MDENTALLARTLVEMAWADHQLVDAERAALRRLSASLGATPAEIEALAATEPGSFSGPALAQCMPTRQERIAAMSAVMRIAFCDEVLTFEEYDLIERLASLLEINTDELEALRRLILSES